MQFDDAALQGSLLDASPVIRAEIWGECLRHVSSPSPHQAQMVCYLLVRVAGGNQPEFVDFRF